MDTLERLVGRSFRDVCEAEKIAHAGPKGRVYEELLTAHSALLRAKHALRALERARARGAAA